MQHLTCNRDIGYLLYRATTILFQIFFEYKFLKKIPREYFLPHPQQINFAKEKKLAKIKSINTDYLYLVHMVPRRNLHELCSQEDLQSLWYFVKQNCVSRKNRVIPNMEWVIWIREIYRKTNIFYCYLGNSYQVVGLDWWCYRKKVGSSIWRMQRKSRSTIYRNIHCRARIFRIKTIFQIWIFSHNSVISLRVRCCHCSQSFGHGQNMRLVHSWHRWKTAFWSWTLLKNKTSMKKMTHRKKVVKKWSQVKKWENENVVSNVVIK